MFDFHNLFDCILRERDERGHHIVPRPRAPKQADRCQARAERRMSGRGGFPSVWYVQCTKVRVGKNYCAQHRTRVSRPWGSV
jgi:hypothetical protein